MKVKVSRHACSHAVDRLNIDPLQAASTLQAMWERGTPTSFVDAAKQFSMTDARKGDMYRTVYYEKGNIREWVCLIVRSNNIVTLLTEKIYSSPFRRQGNKLVVRKARLDAYGNRLPLL